MLGSIGSVGDAYDNAMAESFAGHLQDRAHRRPPLATTSQLELAIVSWVSWFNHDRLHSELGHIPPAEHEALYAARTA